MKKSICLCAGVLVICLQMAAQCGSKKSKESEKPSSYVKSNCSKSNYSKSISSKSYNSKSYTSKSSSKSRIEKKLIPYVEASYQVGLWGEKMPVSFIAGVE